MAISTTTNTVLLAGNGSSVVFSYSFPFFNQTDLHVYLFDTLAGGITPQVLGTNYSIAAVADSTGIFPNGGNVVFNSSVVATSIVVIDRQPVQNQTFTIIQNGFISTVGLTHQLDYLTLLIQDMADRASRCVALPTGFGGTFNPQLPSTIAEQSSAFMVLAVNSGASGWNMVPIPGVGSTGLWQVSLGGTGQNSPLNPGGVIFAANSSAMASTLANTPGFPLIAQGSSGPIFGALNLAQSGAVAGTVTALNGGTGISGFTPFGVFYGSSATQMAQALPTGTSFPLMSNGSAAPSFQALSLATSSVTGVLPINLGGTGANTAGGAFFNLSPLLTQGDLIYGGPGAVGTRLPPNTSNSSAILVQTGSGAFGAPPSWAVQGQKTITQFTSVGSSTYTAPTGCKWIWVRMVGAGGGGGGNGNATNGTASGKNGGNTLFGSSVMVIPLVCNGGSGGGNGPGSASGGTVPAGFDVAVTGTPGATGVGNTVGIAQFLNSYGLNGASSQFGSGGQAGSNGAGTGFNASGFGSGGGSAGGTNTQYNGTSGASGGYLEKTIIGPSGSYPVSIGAGGAGGSVSGSSVTAGGGNGASGYIVIEEHYI